MKIIGVDIGGTKMDFALVEGEQIVRTYSCATPATGSKEFVVSTLADGIEKLLEPETAGIGIGVPGLVDIDRGDVFDVVNIPAWDRVPLREILHGRFKLPVFINNDANCFATGEKYFGKGKPFKHFAGVTLGTGLGAGLIVNGHLYPGRYCAAGEFGAMHYLDRTIEAYASGQFFKDRGLSGLQVAGAARGGDQVAKELFAELGRHIGFAVMQILFAFAPEAVVFGGSLVKSFDLFEGAMKQTVHEKFPYRKIADECKIEVSDLRNAAVLGAAALVLDAV